MIKSLNLISFNAFCASEQDFFLLFSLLMLSYTFLHIFFENFSTFQDSFTGILIQNLNHYGSSYKTHVLRWLDEIRLSVSLSFIFFYAPSPSLSQLLFSLSLKHSFSLANTPLVLQTLL